MLSVSPWSKAQIIQDDLKLRNMHSAYHNYQMHLRLYLYRSTIAEEDFCSFHLTFLIFAWQQTRAKQSYAMNKAKPGHERELNQYLFPFSAEHTSLIRQQINLKTEIKRGFSTFHHCYSVVAPFDWYICSCQIV